MAGRPSPANVGLGVTAENQVDVTLGGDVLRHIHWIICGGESGAKARPMHPAGARALQAQAIAWGAAFFFKQWGTWVPPEECEPDSPLAVRFRSSGPDFVFLDGQPMMRGHKKSTGRRLGGAVFDGLPDVG